MIRYAGRYYLFYSGAGYANSSYATGYAICDTPLGPCRRVSDRPLLETVHAFLDERRPVATELYTIGCVYKPLGVAVAVQIREGHVREQVLVQVRLALRRYLWPLPSAPRAAWETGPRPAPPMAATRSGAT